MAKSPEEVKLWREQQKLDGTNAMAEYKEAEGSARDRLARLPGRASYAGSNSEAALAQRGLSADYKDTNVQNEKARQVKG